MDGQNMGNEQNSGNQQSNQPAQYSYYQDNTANIPYQTPVEAAEPDTVNALQVVGLVCGIAGIILGCCVGAVGIIFGIIGLICAILGNKQSKTGVGTGGLVCSIISIILGVISLLIGLIFGAALITALQESGDLYY